MWTVPMRSQLCRRILLVEDEEADIFHFQRLCKKHQVTAELVIARNGDAALERLRQEGLSGGRWVIVTDINMPGLTGHELIEEIRNDDDLTSNVIFVVSSSDLPDDIEKAYARHVAGYIVKDPHGEQLSAGIAMLNHYVQAVTIL
jgi:CheY-like chemotaxis protein